MDSNLAFITCLPAGRFNIICDCPTLKTLSKSEFIGRLTSNKTTRVIPMKHYLIFYEINSGKIEIVSFWDNRQVVANAKTELTKKL